MRTRTYLDVRFDVTELNDDERSTLAMDVSVQAEPVDSEEPVEGDTHIRGHHGVPYPEIEWNEVEVEEEGDWCVGEVKTGNMIRVGSEAEAMTALAGIELVDPEGIVQGMYFVDPPGNEDEGPGESSIYFNDPRYWTVDVLEDEDTSSHNRINEVARAAKQKIVGLVDEECGGVIAYMVESEGERLAEALNKTTHESPSPALRNHATSGVGHKAFRPHASEGESETDFVLTVCINGIPETYNYHAIGQAIDAVGEAMCRYDEEPTKIVTLLLSRMDEEFRGGQKPRFLDARGAAHILFGDQIDDLDFDPRTAQFESGADVAAALDAHFNLSDDEYRSLRRS